MGRGLYGYRVGVVNRDGIEVERGETGIIAIRVNPPPHGLFSGYLIGTDTDKRELSHPATAFVGDWYLSGDLGYMDKEGYVYFIARDDDIIISSS